jgi:hypothetical protein
MNDIAYVNPFKLFSVVGGKKLGKKRSKGPDMDGSSILQCRNLYCFIFIKKLGVLFI